MSINQLGDKTTGHSIGLAYLSDLSNNPRSLFSDTFNTIPSSNYQFISETIGITKPSYILAILNVNVSMDATIQLTSGPSVYQIFLNGEPINGLINQRITQSIFPFINSLSSASSTQSNGVVMMDNTPYPIGSHTFTAAINILSGNTGSFGIKDFDLTLIPIAYNVGV